MSKYMCTLISYKTQAEAMKVAEAVFTATKGMFACLEGEVWVSWNVIANKYDVWIIEQGGTYIPPRNEIWDACTFEKIDAFYVANSLVGILKSQTDKKQLKWKRYS